MAIFVNDKEPRYLNAPVTTTYRYVSFFDITVDNKNINEIEMLKLMGLNNEVDKLLTYKKELFEYDSFFMIIIFL